MVVRNRMSKFSLIHLILVVILMGFLSVFVLFVLYKPNKVPHSAIKVTLPIDFSLDRIDLHK
jgi:hypothetical protein